MNEASSAALLAVVVMLVACDTPDTDPLRLVVEGTRAGPSTHEPAMSRGCDSGRVLWSLGHDGAWLAVCLDAALERDTGLWASDGLTIASLYPQGCTTRRESVSVQVLAGSAVEHHATTLDAWDVTDGGGVWLEPAGGALHYYGGEGCTTGTNRGVHRMVARDGAAVERPFWRNIVWPMIVGRRGRVLVTAGVELLRGELDLFTAPGLEFEPNALCWEVWPTGPNDLGSPRYCASKTRTRWKADRVKKGFYRRAGEGLPPAGRELSWVYDPKRDRLVTVGVLEPSAWVSSELDPTPLEWRLHEEAWSLSWSGTATQLPKPPVLGDGVTLLWHPELEQVVLLDPYGTRSWLLAADDSAWTVWKEHAPLAPPPGRELPESTQSGAQRFTQWWAPHFAAWDAARGAPVVVHYDDPHSLCLPVAGLRETFACPKAHP